MGVVTTEYRASVNLTVTNLSTLASSGGLLAGWTSGTIDNTTNKDLDNAISARFTLGAAPTAGQIQVYAYAMLDDSTWPTGAFSAGTAGTEGTATIIDDEQKNATLVLLWSTATDTGASEAHNMPPTSVRKAFGFMPAKYAVFVTHSTVQALASAQVTNKGIGENVA